MEACSAFTAHTFWPAKCATCKCSKDSHAEFTTPTTVPKRKGSAFAKSSPRRASVLEGGVGLSGYLVKKSSGPIQQQQSRYFEISGHYLK